MGRSLNGYRTRFHWSGVGEDMLTMEVKASECSKAIKFGASATTLEALDIGFVTDRVEQLRVRGNLMSLYKSRNETSDFGCQLRLQFRNNRILNFLERRRAVSEESQTEAVRFEEKVCPSAQVYTAILRHLPNKGIVVLEIKKD